jgi:hypothetical protein
MKLVLCILLACCLATMQFANAQFARPTLSAVPAWVTVNNYSYDNTSLDHEADGGYVDEVLESQVCLQEQATYVRRSYKILSDAGIEDNSEISVTYDPSYSRLIFHTIQIIRNGKVINQLQLSKIKTLQQEKELARHSYDGSLSAVRILEDIRKGDIIDYSYTIKGFNPIFKGKYASIFETSYSVPVYNLLYKLIVPKERHINIKNSLINIEPSITTINGNAFYEWKLSNVQPVKSEDNTPSWFDPYSMIMVSEYASWNELNEWARKLFPLSVNISQPLRTKIDEINKKERNNEEKVSEALKFVQDAIRYMGIEMGVNSHQPSRPDKIFAQRFGDCKDKSYLLCTMLSQMGIEANPVLLNTTYKKTIEDWLPSPTDFDHVTVRVKLNNKYYWFDPTISYQRGKLENISYPDYQCGLVITDTTTLLTKIPFHDNGITDVKEEFDIPDLYGRAKLTVTTQYTGSFADDVRRSFNDNSTEQMKKFNEKYYAYYFDNIKSDSISYTDDESTGKFITREYYSIKDLWEMDKGEKRVSFQPYVILGAMKKPNNDNRYTPLSLSFPANYKEDIEVNLPEEWKGDEIEHNVKCSDFNFTSQYSYTYRQFHLQYNYEALKDHVGRQELEEYTEKYKAANATIAYELSEGMISRDSSRNALGGRTLAVLFVILIGLIIWFVKRV